MAILLLKKDPLLPTGKKEMLGIDVKDIGTTTLNLEKAITFSP